MYFKQKFLFLYYSLISLAIHPHCWFIKFFIIMKSPKGILFVLMLLSFVLLHAQTTNQWTWMGGNKVADQSGRYGTKGVASTNNYPGTRFGSIYFSDKNGNFWLFGGTGIDAAGNGGLLNDLWKFDGTNWTWVSGSNIVNQSGTRATRGTPNPANTPGSRQNGAGGVDNNGNIWIFGGEGYFDTTQIIGPASTGDALNDLWKFDGYNWTWMAGSNTIDQISNYGIKGSPSTNNSPGARSQPLSWKDNAGNFWLWGGYGKIFGSDRIFTKHYGYLNDLWKFNYGYVTALPNSPTIIDTHSSLLLLNNPSFTVEFRFLSDQYYKKLQWQLLDENGRLLQESELQSIPKNAVQTVITHHINSGIYFIFFIGDDKKFQTLKWLKL